jgi:hypothetical protein
VAVLTQPVVSVVVVIVSDTVSRASGSHLGTCLAALSAQRDPPPFEVIVPLQNEVDGIEEVRRRFPAVTFVPVAVPNAGTAGGREHHDVLRARGMTLARGDIIALLEDHGRPDERWCANVAAAHREPFAAIGGAVENGIDRALNWAVYYCDFGRYQNPVPRGEARSASDANVTYKRAALEKVRATWEASFREVVVNGALMARGEQVALTPDVVVYQHRQGLRLGEALRERFIWGRSFAATRLALLSGRQRAAYTLLSPLLPAVLLVRMTATAWRRRRHFGRFVMALPLTSLLTAAWSAGEAVGYAAGLRTPATTS